jgi:hypothetical protein
MTVVRYFDEQWRLGVVVSKGPKFISLLDVGLLCRVWLPRSDERYLQKVEDIAARRLARRIEARRRQLRRHGIRHAAAVARSVADDLRKPGT